MDNKKLIFRKYFSVSLANKQNCCEPIHKIQSQATQAIINTSHRNKVDIYWMLCHPIRKLFYLVVVIAFVGVFYFWAIIREAPTVFPSHSHMVSFSLTLILSTFGFFVAIHASWSFRKFPTSLSPPVPPLISLMLIKATPSRPGQIVHLFFFLSFEWLVVYVARVLI